MAIISFTQLQDGATAVNAASVNNPLNTIYNDYNGNITSANIANGSLTGSDLASSTVTSSNIDFTTFGWTTGSSTVTGWSSTTDSHFVYFTFGKLVLFVIDYNGTSNSTSVIFTLPQQAAYQQNGSVGLAVDNGTVQAASRWEVTANSTTLTVFSTMTGNGWTASGTKQVRMVGFYQAQ